MALLIHYNTYRRLSPERGTGFNLYFAWPVFSKNIGETIAKLPSEKLDKKLYRLLLDQVEKPLSKGKLLFGIDLLLELSEGTEYAVALGVINKSSWRDLITAQELLRNLGLNTVPMRADSLYQFLMNTKNYEGYLLREYRSGATKLQSYFKDDNIADADRLIYERLENDWRDGLRPYKATLKKLRSSIKIQIDGRGIITMPILPEETQVLNLLIQKMIKDHITVRVMVKKAKMERLEIPRLQLFGHTNLILRLRTENKVSMPAPKDESLKESDTVENFIKYLEESAGVYGKRVEEGYCSFNLLYEETSQFAENRFSSSFSVDIRPKTILVSPTFPPMLQDLLHLYYSIDRYFQVEHGVQFRYQ